MSVRNPYRPWWTEIEWDEEAAEYVAEETSRAWQRTRAMSGEHRIRWAARHSCKRLHQKLAAATERIAELELRLEHCAELRQGLGLHVSQLDARIDAAQQENARMREALHHAYEALAHLRPCGHDGDEEGGRCYEDCELCACDSAVEHIADALALDAEGGDDGEA